FLTRTKTSGKFRKRQRETLFIDARKMGQMVDRTHRELADAEIAHIAWTYHAWRGEKDAEKSEKYKDFPGFCRGVTTDEIAAHGFVLTPGRYVGAEDVEADGEPFEDMMNRLTAKLEQQFAENSMLEIQIRENLRRVTWQK